MKLLFVQIGDMHLQDNEALSDEKSVKLCKALQTIGDVEEVFLEVCGDLSNEGKKGEFKSVRKFIDQVISELKKTYSRKYIHFHAVPGNHDLFLNGKKRTAPEIMPLLNKERDVNYLIETEKLEHFFDYAKSKMFYLSTRAIDTRLIQSCGVQINLINTAPFSSTSKDDKRLHHIPHNDLEKMKKCDGVDINIAIMHHSSEWFCEDTKHALEKALYDNCEVVLQGHDHVDTNTKLENKHSQELKIIRSGVFNVSGNSAEFNAILIDTMNYNITCQRFAWNENEKIFVSDGNVKTDALHKKHSRLFPSKEFLGHFAQDGYKISDNDNLLEYHVFPKLVVKEDVSGRRTNVSTFDEFFRELENGKCICIEGAHRTGKTSIIKALYLEAAMRGFTPLLLENSPSVDSRIDKLVKSIFEDQYSKGEALFDRFMQTDRSKMMFFIDDFDQISHEDVRDKLLTYLFATFGYVVFTTDINVSADLLDRVKNKMQKSNVFVLQLQYMYRSVRTQLINRICDIKGVDEEEKENIVADIDQLIKQVSELFSFVPEFIIKFLVFYLNGGRISEQRGSVFGAIFQSDITRAIQDATHASNVDIYLSVLDEIAYYMHFSKMAVISSNEILETIDSYNKEYSESVNAKSFVEAMCDANLLDEDNVLGSYRFKDRNVLAYFVARKLSKNYERDSEDLYDISAVVRNICFGINATVILFLSFLRNNVRLIMYFIDEVELLLNNTPELDIDGEHALFLRTPFKSVDTRTVTEKRKGIDKEAEESEQLILQSQVKYKDIYEYNEDLADDPRYNTGRAIKCLEIISKSLLSMRGNLRSDEKSIIVNSIYTLPNRIMYKHFLPYNEQFESFEEKVNQLYMKFRLTIKSQA